MEPAQARYIINEDRPSIDQLKLNFYRSDSIIIERYHPLFRELFKVMIVLKGKRSVPIRNEIPFSKRKVK